MPKMPSVTARKLIAAVLRQGFFVDRQRGSHVIVKHVDGRMASIPLHPGDLSFRLLHGILKDLDLTVNDLYKIL